MLDIPDTVPTPFVIATEQPLRDPVAVAHARVRQRLAADLLGTSLVRIRTLPVGDSGYSELMSEAAWARSEDRSLLHKFTHHIVVMGHVPPVSQPDHGQALRAIARAIAEACDGLVYDAWSHQVLPHDFRHGVEHPEFCLADDWLATFISEGGGPSAEGRVPLRRAGLQLTTAGLHRFALPELEARSVPVSNVFAAVTLLRCLAVTLLYEHWDWLACNPGARSRHLPDHAWVEGRDVWRYWAAEPTATVGGRVHVRLQHAGEQGPEVPPHEQRPEALPYGQGPEALPYGQGPEALPYLAVGPPSDFAGRPREWWNDVVDLSMLYVPEAPRRTAA
jgi:hypothetical protein